MRSPLLGALLASLLVGGCRSMQHEVRIRAQPAEVWAVVADIEKYEEWNPFFIKAVGELRVDEKLEVTMQPVGKGKQTFKPRVLVVDEGKQLVWRGRLGIPGLFDGRHTFTIQRIDEETVLFKQHEKFSGLLVPFAGLGPYEKGWELMDQALQKRVERRPMPASDRETGPSNGPVSTATERHSTRTAQLGVLPPGDPGTINVPEQPISGR